jgi:hypothetical protein
VTIEFSNHPEYDDKAPELQKYRDLYEGDHAVLIRPQYLWPHELESSNKIKGTDPQTGQQLTVGEYLRTIRARRSRYLNVMESIVSAWISLLFHKPIKMDDEVKTLLGEEGLADIDGEGTSFEDFIKGPIAEAYFRDGNPVVLVDSPSGVFRNKEEQTAAGFRPYMELLDRLAVKDWQYFESGEQRGKYQWIRYEYKVVAPRASSQDKPELEEYSKEFTVTSGQYQQLIYKKEDGKWIEQNSVDFPDWDVLPITTIRANEPWVKDISEQQLVLFNVMSAWYNQLNTQAFQRGILAGDLAKEHSIAISEYTWAMVPLGTTATVIEPSSTEPLTSAMEQTVDQMYRIGFNRSRGLSSDSKEAPSESTLREMNSELVSLILTSMGQIESLVNESLQYYARFKGIENFEGKITLSRDLTADDVMKQAEVYAIYRDEIRKVLSWRKAHLKKVALQMSYSDEEIEDIEKDIDALKEEQLTQPIQLNGRQDIKQAKAASDETADAFGSEVGRADRAVKKVPGQES